MSNLYIKRVLSTVLLSAVLITVNCRLFSQNIVIKDALIENSVNMVSSKNQQQYIVDLLKFHTRHNLSTQTDAKKGIGAATDYLESTLRSFGNNNSRFFTQRYSFEAGGEGTRLGRKIILTNIVATIEGKNTNDNRMIVLLAHYDTRVDNNNDSTSYAPGANDNGSGVAALLEIARILSSTSTGLTVKLMFLAGEEHGLLGAAHMARVAKENNWNIIAVLNNDMISNSQSSETDSRNNTVVRVFSENISVTETENEERERVFNSMENDSPSRQLARYVKEIGERYVENISVKLIYRNDRFGRGGDHTPFSRSGFTAVRICEYYENYHRTHQLVAFRNGIQYGDVIEGVDFEYLRKNTSINLATVLNLANAPDVPLNPVTDVSSLSNTTNISWQSPVYGDVPAGYYLLIRETDSPVWQKKIFVRGNSVTVPLSKDNYFFGVQSVNEKGNESLIMFSKAAR